MAGRLGIGLVTHNRPEIFAKTLAEVKRYAPHGSKIVVVDDASDVPVKEATFRFDTNVGIARSKNKCLELLEDCEDIFLFDDDCYAQADNWWRPYVESPEVHLMYIFKDFVNMQLNDSIELYRDSKLKAYSHPRGCMLYLHRSVLDVVGGMDTRYKRWGYEHVDYSNRIFNAGLTTFRYADVVDSQNLIYSRDEHQEVASTVSRAERAPYLREMLPHFRASFKSTEYCPYKETPRHQFQGTNLVLTTYLNGMPDPQRGEPWPADYEATKALRESVARHGEKLVLISDCFQDVKHEKSVEIEHIEPITINPYFARWIVTYQYLRAHPEVDGVFCVDSTDVEMLKSPFGEMDDRLYVGDEPTTLGTPWMLQHHRVPALFSFLRANARLPLLNCGLVGGSRELVMQFIHDMLAFYFDNNCRVGDFEMGTFNYVAYTKYKSVLSYGPHVNSTFKAYDYNNSTAFFRHK